MTRYAKLLRYSFNCPRRTDAFFYYIRGAFYRLFFFVRFSVSFSRMPVSSHFTFFIFFNCLKNIVMNRYRHSGGLLLFSSSPPSVSLIISNFIVTVVVDYCQGNELFLWGKKRIVSVPENEPYSPELLQTTRVRYLGSQQDSKHWLPRLFILVIFKRVK